MVVHYDMVQGYLCHPSHRDWEFGIQLLIPHTCLIQLDLQRRTWLPDH